MNVSVGLSRLDAGRAFFATFYAFILVGWYPQLQPTFVQASRGADFASLGLIALVVGAAFGSGGLVDALLFAAAAALGSGAGIGLGAALVAELSEVRPFYASTLDPITLESMLWAEFVPAVVGPALGGLAGAIGATVLGSRSATLGLRAAVLGIFAVALIAAGTVALGAASIGLVVGRVSAGGPAPTMSPAAIRLAILALSCLAAVSAVLVRRPVDGRLTVAITIPRLVAVAALVGIPYLVADVYRSFVVNPF
jgi:hypothetical protein